MTTKDSKSKTIIADDGPVPTQPKSEGGRNAGAAPAPVLRDLDRVLDVRVDLSVELGRRRMSIAEVLALAPGSVVEFNKASNEPMDVFVNDQLVARGEAVVVGERYAVRVTEVVSPTERLRHSGVSAEALP